ncbi:MAG: cobyric acid synthase CobQ, partial [Dethiosulfovibrio sp.]|nr:cobyric acid synthase CobQ [Dethiosulfovibrio sp.]
LWMRDNGLERSILDLASKGTSIVGICGGFQMMGRFIRDPEGIESDDPKIRGMGLLDVATDFCGEKRTVRTRGQVIGTGDSFVPQRGMEVEGYEIHMGRTVSNSPIFSLSDGTDGASDPSGRIWGTYLHGVFDLPEFRRAWLTSLGWSRSGEPLSLKDFRERAFDRLADHMEEHIDMRSLEAILGL